MLKIILFLCLVPFYPAQAKVFKKIYIKGLKKTKKAVIQNELQLFSGKDYSQADIEAAKSRLLSTNLFSDVQHKMDGDLLGIIVAEKWTTIPILKFSSSGDVQETTLGIFDPNVFGHFIELGAQATRLGETTSGAIWFKNPRLFGTKNTLEVQLWKQNRLRTKYDQNSEVPVATEGFLHKRDKLFLNYEHVVNSQLSLRAIYEYNKDNFSDELLPEEVPFSTKIPNSSKYHFIGSGIKYKPKSSAHSPNIELGLELRYGIATEEGQNNFWTGFGEFRLSHFVCNDNEIAFRFMSGATDTDVLQFWHYLGGLDRIRGFEDNRFAGSFYWLSNLEYRAPVLKTKNYILMATAFSDTVAASDDIGGLGAISGASVGLGVRVILPKIYRFVVRLDYAQPIKSEAGDENAISFGVQHFF